MEPDEKKALDLRRDNFDEGSHCHIVRRQEKKWEERYKLDEEKKKKDDHEKGTKERRKEN